MDFEILGKIVDVEVIARGPHLRNRAQLNRIHGYGDWRKLKGCATIRYGDGTTREVELHWYEAHGIGKRGMKIKRELD